MVFAGGLDSIITEGICGFLICELILNILLISRLLMLSFPLHIGQHRAGVTDFLQIDPLPGRFHRTNDIEGS